MNRKPHSRAAPRFPMGEIPLPSDLGTLLWDALPLGMCLLSAEQTLLFVNRSASRLLRRSSRDCVEKIYRRLSDIGLTSRDHSKPQEFGNWPENGR